MAAEGAPRLLREVVVHPVWGQRVGDRGKGFSNCAGFPGAMPSHSRGGGRNGRWALHPVVGVTALPGATRSGSRRVQVDLGDGRGPRGTFSTEELPLAWLLAMQQAAVYGQLVLAHIDWHRLHAAVAAGKPGATELLAGLLAAAKAAAASAAGDAALQAGLQVLLARPEQLADRGADDGSSSDEEEAEAEEAEEEAQQQQDQPAPPAPADAGSLDARARGHISRQAAHLLRAGLQPVSGTPSHTIGHSLQAWFSFTAHELFGCQFPGNASVERIMALWLRIKAAGVLVGSELADAVAELEWVTTLQLDGMYLRGQSELPDPSLQTLQQQAHGGDVEAGEQLRRATRLVVEHTASFQLLDPAGPPRPPLPDPASGGGPADLQLVQQPNSMCRMLPWPDYLNGPKSGGGFIPLSLLYARYPEQVGPQLPQAWLGDQAQLSRYMVFITTDGSPAPVLTVEQWQALPTLEHFSMRLAAHLWRQFCASQPHIAPAQHVACGGCERCSDPAEALAAEMTDSTALSLRLKFGGSSATLTDLQRHGPTTRPLALNGKRVAPLRCHSASRSSRFKGSATVAAAAAGEAAIAEADGAEAEAAQAAEAAALAALAEEEEAGEAGGQRPPRPPLELQELAQAAVEAVSHFLHTRCACPPEHPQHLQALERCTRLALYSLWRSWQVITPHQERCLQRAIRQAAGQLVAAAFAALAEQQQQQQQQGDVPNDEGSGGEEGSGSDDDDSDGGGAGLLPLRTPLGVQWKYSWCQPRCCWWCSNAVLFGDCQPPHPAQPTNSYGPFLLDLAAADLERMQQQQQQQEQQQQEEEEQQQQQQPEAAATAAGEQAEAAALPACEQPETAALAAGEQQLLRLPSPPAVVAGGQQQLASAAAAPAPVDAEQPEVEHQLPIAAPHAEQPQAAGGGEAADGITAEQAQVLLPFLLGWALELMEVIEQAQQQQPPPQQQQQEQQQAAAGTAGAAGAAGMADEDGISAPSSSSDTSGGGQRKRQRLE